jgi:HPt (histidine-containing phosphotransfer) domain-containing protein
MGTANFEFNSRLDVYFLSSIYENDVEHAEMVFEKFIQTIQVQMNELEVCYAEGNTEFFRKKIHKIKPVLSFVGLTPLTNKATLIEKNCSLVTDINVLAELYTGFKNELNEMIPVVENDLAKLKAITV